MPRTVTKILLDFTNSTSLLLKRGLFESLSTQEEQANGIQILIDIKRLAENAVFEIQELSKNKENQI